jgi:predicted dehydrogenase
MGSPTLTTHILKPAPLAPTDRLRVGLVGAGVISAQYLASIERLTDVDLVAVADLDSARAAQVADSTGARAMTVGELLSSDDVDVVLNLTIPAAHVEVCTDALLAGKHVYVEKPLALNVDEGKGLLRLAAERDLRLSGAPDTVLGTGIQTARAILDRGDIGTPIAATASWSSPGHERWHPAPDFYYQPGGGPLFDMGPYYLTALVTLLGPVTRVSATSIRSDRKREIGTGPRSGAPIDVAVDTHVTAVLEHAGGAVSTVLLSFEVWGSRLPHIEVFGSAGSLSVPDPNRFDGVVEVLDTSREWSPVADLAGYVGSGRGYGLADLARAKASGEPHRLSGDLALHVVDIMESIQTAGRAHRAVDLSTTATRPALVPLTDLAYLGSSE